MSDGETWQTVHNDGPTTIDAGPPAYPTWATVEDLAARVAALTAWATATDAERRLAALETWRDRVDTPITLVDAPSKYQHGTIPPAQPAPQCAGHVQQDVGEWWCTSCRAQGAGHAPLSHDVEPAQPAPLPYDVRIDPTMPPDEMLIVDRKTGSQVRVTGLAQPAPLPREPETCERHGCRIVNHTLVCGAPQCCPECCKEAADMDKPQPAPLPGPVADAVGWLRRMCEPYTDDVADALAAWATAQAERDARIAALCNHIASTAWYRSDEWRIARRQLLDAAAELAGHDAAGDGGGA